MGRKMNLADLVEVLLAWLKLLGEEVVDRQVVLVPLEQETTEEAADCASYSPSRLESYLVLRNEAVDEGPSY